MRDSPALYDNRERALPAHAGQTREDYLIYLKQAALYRAAQARCTGRTVLDLGCGEGYGSALLAESARVVIAVDYSWQAVAHAAGKYGKGTLAFVVCDAQALPFRTCTYEVVISYEVIEHLANVRRYLTEIRRVSTPDSTVMLSTPNRLLRLLPLQKPWNRFHRREYDASDFAGALQAVFRNVHLSGVVATPEVMAVEKRRIKQNPWIAYPRMIAQSVLPSRLYERLDRMDSRGPHQGALTAPDELDGKATVDDFILSDRELQGCLTLVAVCNP